MYSLVSCSIDYPGFIQGEKPGAPREAFAGDVIVINHRVNHGEVYTGQAFLHWVAARIAQDAAGSAVIQQVLMAFSGWVGERRSDSSSGVVENHPKFQTQRCQTLTSLQLQKRRQVQYYSAHEDCVIRRRSTTSTDGSILEVIKWRTYDKH